MRFNPRARLDRSRVRDTGRGGGFGGGATRLPIPGGAVGGGGLGGVLLVIAFVVLTQCVGGGGGGGGLGSAFDTSRMGAASGGDTARYDGCRTGADANESADCARVAVENSLHDFWSDTLGPQFRAEQAMVTFTGSVQTGCGGATSDVGPFYCPVDESIYLDTAFFEAVLQGQLGGPSGAFVEPYVLAHEYGHHIQNVLGTMGRVRTQQGPRSDAVRLELQADCYAGMWARAASTTEDVDGVVLFDELTQEDVRVALEAAAAVGDDRIQRKTQGQVTAERWTHGSAASRMRWFTTGYEAGDLAACDTWAVETP